MPALESIPLEDLVAEIRRRREMIDAAEIDSARRDKWRSVTRAVARAFGLPHKSLWAQNRSITTTQARQASMVIMRETLGMTMGDIAEVFRKNHVTVIHAIQTQPGRMTDPRYCQSFETARAALI